MDNFVSQLLQLLFSGLMVGSIYAVVALGFTMIYSATGVVNFAQGEFLMLGGMVGVSLFSGWMPLIIACVVAVFLTALIGIIMERMMIAPLKNPTVLALIIITIGASIVLKGGAMLLFGKQAHSLPAFSGDVPLMILGAAVFPQALWIMGISLLLIIGIRLMLSYTMFGIALRATADNSAAASLVGIDIRLMVRASFGLSAASGAIAGIIITPVTLTSWDIGMMLGIKGFSAAMLGGLGNVVGSVIGGLLLGVIETFGAGLIASGYRDAFALLVLLLVLFLRPSGLFGTSDTR